MSYLPQYYFDDIPADEMKEIMNGMVLSERELEISRCESRNHREHQGELWQCAECLSGFECAWFDEHDYFEFFPLQCVFPRPAGKLCRI